MHSDAGAVHSSNGVSPAAQLDLGFAERRTSVLEGVEEVTLPKTIVKRDGRIVAFDPMRIERAISRCFAALGRTAYTPIPELAVRVVNIMSARPAQPTVEIVQDAVELTLQAAGEFEAAKAYILYRAEHAKQRQERPVPDQVRAAFAEADRVFPTPIQKFQFFDKYSRFDYDKGRRETWIETVDRAVSFLHELVQTNTGADLGSELYERLRRMILEMKSMPSMRLLAMAGPPARRDNTSIYNCSALPVDSIEAFCEALLISMAGCGVGFSVESRYVENFPRVQRQRGGVTLRHTVEDSAQGWAAAVRLGMQTWFEGGDIDFNFDEVRPAGSPLRTKGGRASGPGPLHTMLEFARARVLARQGMHLRPIDAHDIMCMVGNAAVSGGVRRTAMISLFDYDDLEMRLCKSGDFERDNSQRWNANNSAVWPERGLDQIQVIEQVLDMVKSQRGEPGIFNRQATLDLQPERRKRFGYTEYLTNPCGEIVLRKWGFCNLSVAVARSDDTFESLKDKVEVA
ncbi:MAG: recombinase, partial [Chloroflexi bacterium]